MTAIDLSVIHYSVALTARPAALRWVRHHNSLRAASNACAPATEIGSSWAPTGVLTPTATMTFPSNKILPGW